MVYPIETHIKDRLKVTRGMRALSLWRSSSFKCVLPSRFSTTGDIHNGTT